MVPIGFYRTFTALALHVDQPQTALPFVRLWAVSGLAA